MLLYVLTVIALMRNVTCPKIKATGDIREASIRTEMLQGKTTGHISADPRLDQRPSYPTWAASSSGGRRYVTTVLSAAAPYLILRVSIPYKNNFLIAKGAATVPLSSRAERNQTGWGVQLSRLFTLKKINVGRVTQPLRFMRGGQAAPPEQLTPALRWKFRRLPRPGLCWVRGVYISASINGRVNLLSLMVFDFSNFKLVL